jgi:glutathione S-transferase
VTDICLFHTPGACSRVVMNALEEAGVSFDDQPVNLMKGEQRSPEMLALNPKGKVPALRVGDQLLTENPSILLYLDEAHPEAELLPRAANALERAETRSDLIWLSNTVHPLVRICMMPARAAPNDPEGARSVAREALTAIFAGIDGRMARNGWWYGGWSIMDVYIDWCASTAAAAGVDLAAFPAILAQSEKVRARSSFVRALAREQRAMETAGIQLPPGAKL